jgi:hypothetical protein
VLIDHRRHRDKSVRHHSVLEAQALRPRGGRVVASCARPALGARVTLIPERRGRPIRGGRSEGVAQRYGVHGAEAILP